MKHSQPAVTFNANQRIGIHTPPRAGPSRKRTFSGSSSNKSAGHASPKRRKFVASPKSKVSTRTKRVTKAKSKVPPAKAKPAAKGKGKQPAKSKEVLTDTDDESMEPLPAVPKKVSHLFMPLNHSTHHICRHLQFQPMLERSMMTKTKSRMKTMVLYHLQNNCR